jgi:hypothetical protein
MEAGAMGIDWAWMIPRPEATRARLEQLIEEQAGEVLARGRSEQEDFRHLPRPAGPAPEAEWAADGLLLDVVDVEWDNCRRVSFIGLCPLLPAEWRRGAYRSFLPDRLEAAVRMWSSQIDTVRAAGRQGYAYAWYRYARQRDIGEGWADLLDHAGRLLARGNHRTHPPALLGLCDRAQALAAVPFAGLPMMPAPLWGQSGYPVPDDEQAYEAACDMLEEWNRLAPAWPVRFLRYPSYEEFVVEQASSDFLQDGLGWLWEAVGNGRGLYLWH